MTLSLLLALACVDRLPPETAAPANADVPGAPDPGLNDRFLDPELDVDDWVERFEVESREVVARQPAILAAVGLQPGERVADIGAGTGLYLAPFAEAVGSEGKVYAVDISPRFIEHLQARVEAEGLDQAEVVAGTASSVLLPEGSIDVAFVCDTYHHFEQPEQVLASLHAALVPGGRLYVVDFERVEGESSRWILGHVRAGKEVFSAEIEAAGFRSAGELEAGLEENYLLGFVRD